MRINRRQLLILAAIALLAALIGGRAASGLYVQAIWFEHLDFADYFWSLFGYRIAVGLTAAFVAGGFLFINLYPLTRQHPRLQIRRRYGDIEIAELFPRWYLIMAAIAVSTLLAVAMGLYVGRNWTLPVLQLLNAPEWGRVDPLFGRDLSHFVFELPVLSSLHAFLFVLLLVTALAVILAYLSFGGLAYSDGDFHASKLARQHLGILVGVAFVLLAWGYWLGMQELLWEGHGVTGSLGYADVHARLPVRRLLITVCALAGIASFVGAYRRTFLYAVIAFGVVLVGGLVVDRAYPTIVQKLRVEPNELERERSYLEWNMEHTRAGYGLDAFAERDYPLELQRLPDQQMMQRVTAGLPLWDTRPLRATYNQFQGINPYYTFVDVDYDRYGSDGEIRQVAVAVREIDISQLPREARTWQNLHLSETYTHGLGLVMSPAARITAAGEPAYYLAGIPPTLSPSAAIDVEITHPSVYFGERTRQYVLIPPDETPNPEPQPLGVVLDSFLRKLSFAWSLGDRNLLLSQEVVPGTRILYERSVQRRVARLAPFLALDADIYPVVHQGRIVWIQDAYTASPYFPLSQRVSTSWGALNYVRNSVKVTVDALTGETRFYVADPADPLIASLQAAFPTLFKPLSEMPAGLRDHLRYPREILLLQAGILRAYHVKDPRAFYHQLDLWDLPVERYREGEEPMQPYHVVMPDPAAEDSPLEYLLVYPFTARGRDNMRAFVVARSDVSRSPQVILFRLPSEQVLGPRQVEVLIDQDPIISQQFTLWQQRGSRIIRGHLLVVPVEGTFIYIEPIFLEAESGGAAPSLSRVIAVSEGGGVAMGESLEGALAALSGDRSDVSTILSVSPESPDLDRLRALIRQADDALRAGNVAEFGRIWSEIRELAGRE